VLENSYRATINALMEEWGLDAARIALMGVSYREDVADTCCGRGQRAALGGARLQGGEHRAGAKEIEIVALPPTPRLSAAPLPRHRQDARADRLRAPGRPAQRARAQVRA